MEDYRFPPKTLTQESIAQWFYQVALDWPGHHFLSFKKLIGSFAESNIYVEF